VANATCSVHGCTRTRFASARCWSHVKQLRKDAGDLCSHDQCEEPRFANGACSAHYSNRYRREGGRKYPEHHKTCDHCDESFVAPKTTAKFCSPKCYSDSKRHRPGRHLPVLHPNPDPVTHLPARHPAVAGTPRRLDWWQLLVSGPCEWCDKGFTAVAASWETRSLYCSKSCQNNASRRRRGRFRVPPGVRQAIYERDGWICQLCDEPVDSSLGQSDVWGATLDHIECQAWTDEPDHSPENLRLAHRWCNSVRGDERYYTAEDLRVA
jgi:hypothetical protein